MVALTDPNLAFLLLLIGLLGITWEIHAPGAIFPGLAGVLCLFFGAFGLWENSPTWYGSGLIVLALLFLAVEGKHGSGGIAAIIGAILLSFGATALVRAPHAIHPMLAISVSLAICLIASFLGYLAMRTRGAACQASVGELVGQVGLSRTEIGSAGTVLVRGEYWQATSQNVIPPGVRVLIDRVQGLTLYVREA
ncbi:MAG: hypothetical protein M3Y72_06525 [Acidobacteriota bacterium]|nr:hypothetical protein [Acidobacteriota bacterium]